MLFSRKIINEAFGYLPSCLRPIGVSPSVSGLCGCESGFATEPGRIGDIKAGLLEIFNNWIKVTRLQPKYNHPVLLFWPGQGNHA